MYYYNYATELLNFSFMKEYNQLRTFTNGLVFDADTILSAYGAMKRTEVDGTITYTNVSEQFIKGLEVFTNNFKQLLQNPTVLLTFFSRKHLFHIHIF